MILSVRLPATTTYRVEVSGWDHQNQFFVAKTDLEWSEERGKQLLLTRAVSGGSILFVRLVHETDLGRALPVPYEVEEIGVASQGQFQFRLHPVLARCEASTMRSR